MGRLLIRRKDLLQIAENHGETVDDLQFEHSSVIFKIVLSLRSLPFLKVFVFVILLSIRIVDFLVRADDVELGGSAQGEVAGQVGFADLANDIAQDRIVCQLKARAFMKHPLPHYVEFARVVHHRDILCLIAHQSQFEQDLHIPVEEGFSTVQQISHLKVDLNLCQDRSELFEYLSVSEDGLADGLVVAEFHNLVHECLDVGEASVLVGEGRVADEREVLE